MTTPNKLETAKNIIIEHTDGQGLCYCSDCDYARLFILNDKLDKSKSKNKQ